jgi:hypothetical protein
LYADVAVGGRTLADIAFADACKARAAMLDTPIGEPTLASSPFSACALG